MDFISFAFTVEIKHPFWGMLCFGGETKPGVAHNLVIFNIDLGSATSMESSRRDLSNDMAEHGPILKNSQNTYYRRLRFTPKAGHIAFPKTGVLFLLCSTFIRR